MGSMDDDYDEDDYVMAKLMKRMQASALRQQQQQKQAGLQMCFMNESADVTNGHVRMAPIHGSVFSNHHQHEVCVSIIVIIFTNVILKHFAKCTQHGFQLLSANTVR